MKTSLTISFLAAVMLAAVTGCTANVENPEVDQTGKSDDAECQTDCDESNTTCVAKCGDDSCKATCKTTLDKCTSTCTTSK